MPGILLSPATKRKRVSQLNDSIETTTAVRKFWVLFEQEFPSKMRKLQTKLESVQAEITDLIKDRDRSERRKRETASALEKYEGELRKLTVQPKLDRRAKLLEKIRSLEVQLNA